MVQDIKRTLTIGNGVKNVKKMKVYIELRKAGVKAL